MSLITFYWARLKTSWYVVRITEVDSEAIGFHTNNVPTSDDKFKKHRFQTINDNLTIPSPKKDQTRT